MMPTASRPGPLPIMKRTKKFLKFVLKLSLVGLILGCLTIAAAWLIIVPDLPETEALKDVQLQVPLRVYTADEELIGVFGEQRRIPASIDEIPKQLQQAFLAGEDARFYEHPGVDYQGILRAVWHLVKTGGEKGPGGSTITMQLTRQFFLSLERTYTRKLKEIFLALQIEQDLSKDEILELYLNKIYLGHRAYGIGAAAEVYYGKKLTELTLAESAMLASLPKAPSRINPINNPERSLLRRNYVLRRMHELGHIDDQTFEQALNAPDRAHLHNPTVEVQAPYVAEMARAEAINQLGNKAYTGGYSIHTTIDGQSQLAAQRALRSGLMAYSVRHGYRGPEARIEIDTENGSPAEWSQMLEGYRVITGLIPALVIGVSELDATIYLADGQMTALTIEQMSWARPFESPNRRGATPEKVSDVLAVGDIIRVQRNDEGGWQLTQLPKVQGALVSVDPDNGAIKVLVGGFDFNQSKFNRAVQSKRQPGSSFKPIVYSAALERNFHAATLVNDAPVVFDNPDLEREWRPENYSQKFFGPTRLREGMVNSRNLVSIRVMREIGVSYAHDYALRFGFEADQLPKDLSLALGSGPVPPLAMARAYAVFANGGFLIEPYFIERIIDADDQALFEALPPTVCHEECTNTSIPEQQNPLDISATISNPQAPRAISAPNRFIIHSFLKDVVRRGTGRRAMELGRNDLAGKTGTTNDQRDAWFSGFNDALVTTVWVGHDDYQILGTGEVGGRAALPIWIEYMASALDGVPQIIDPMPAGVVSAKIDPDTGMLAEPGAYGSRTEYFLSGKLPKQTESDQPADPEEIPEDPFDIF